MATLTRTFELSERAKLWRARGQWEPSRRLGGILAKSAATNDRKRLPEALGISPVSYYGILKGRCSYGLLLHHIAPAEIDRLRRRQKGCLTASDSATTESQWRELNLLGFSAIQFYLNVSGSERWEQGCYRVTAVATPAALFGGFGEDLAVFLYHLKYSGPRRS